MNTSRKAPAPVLIGVHLDLKGMNFKPAYIPQYLADLASQGINTVLVEYEDAFPFRGLEIAHDPVTQWSPTLLHRFLAEARRHNLQIIPLQQCLGHLEYALSWNRYRHLAEDRANPNTLRLDLPEAVQFVSTMLEQVIAAHPESKYVHLGMDEALSLGTMAARLERDPLDLFLDQLRLLLRIVEGAGKTAMIWTDMLERHFRPGAFDEFKGRVIVMPWYYFPVNGSTPYAPVGGRRTVTRAWLNDPSHPDAPAITPENNFVEDLSRPLLTVIEPFRRGRMFKPLPFVELWSRVGMQVVGGSALRFTVNGSVLPTYNQQFSNVRGWSKELRAWRQLGQIGTSWARATSWSPPNLCIDLQWPIVSEMAESMGAKPRPFWPGIPAATTQRIFSALGRCREDWRIEGRIAEEMERLAPRLKAHQFEWQSIILMARTIELQRRADAGVAAVEKFHADSRPVDSEWQRLIEIKQALLRDIRRLRQQVRAHFGQRFHGAAYEEWIRHLFDLRIERLQSGQACCRRKLREARRKYARIS